MQPPQNPYSGSGFPGPNDPIPPYGSGGQGYSSGSPIISFDVIGQAWELLKPNLGVYIGAELVFGLIFGFLEVVMITTMPRDSLNQPHPSAVTGVLYLAIVALGLFFNAGFTLMTINNVKTGRANFSDLFAAGYAIPNFILAGILCAIALVCGLCLCVIPYFLLIGLFMFVPHLIVDKRMGAIEAIGTSFNALKLQMWMALLFIIVISIVASLGVIACGVGALVTAPIAALSIAITYRNYFDSGNAQGFGGPSYPVAPIADPRF